MGIGESLKQKIDTYKQQKEEQGKIKKRQQERQAVFKEKQEKAYQTEYQKSRLQYVKVKGREEGMMPQPSRIEKVQGAVRGVQGFAEGLGNFGTNLNKARGTQKLRANQRMSNKQTVKIRGQKYILMPQQPYQAPQQDRGMATTSYQKDRFAALMEVKPMDFHGSNTRDFGALLSTESVLGKRNTLINKNPKGTRKKSTDIFGL
jgi:hypothetical protein